jgi:voltage-gated potassium channel
MITRDYIRELIEPRNDSSASRVYDSIMLSAIIIGILPLMFREQLTIFWYFDLISGLCFVVDYLLRWITADFSSKHNRFLAFVVYPFTPMAIIDLLSILPTFNLISPTFKVVRVSRLLKILRVIKVVRYYEPLEIILAVVRRQSKILWTVFSLAVFYIFITALIMFNAEEDINPETGQYLFDNFFDAFYWAACTLTTVGYGDLYPISDVGRVISIISSMVGIAIIALPSGIVTAGYLDELRSRKEKSEASESERTNQ